MASHNEHRTSVCDYIFQSFVAVFSQRQSLPIYRVMYPVRQIHKTVKHAIVADYRGR